MQLDEATVSTYNKDANRICYVRFIDKNGKFVEDLLFCKPILLSCKAHDLFAILNNFFEENNVDWKYCIRLCTAVICLVASTGYERHCAKWTHCLIHREALASQQPNSDLNEVLKIVVKIVNFIKTRLLKARLFQCLCDKLGAEDNNLLFHCNPRWLSEGKVLFRVYK